MTDLHVTDLHVTDLDEIKDGWITRVSILAPTGIKEATPKASEPNILDGVKRAGGEVRIRLDRRKKAG
jgi:hypothetical protein